MFLKCYLTDGMSAIGYNVKNKTTERTFSDCWINPDTGIILRVDFTDTTKTKILSKTFFNISNPAGCYNQAVLLPTEKKELDDILEEKNEQKRSRKIYK